jgi:hypothetical protein
MSEKQSQSPDIVKSKVSHKKSKTDIDKPVRRRATSNTTIVTADSAEGCKIKIEEELAKYGYVYKGMLPFDALRIAGAIGPYGNAVAVAFPGAKIISKDKYVSDELVAIAKSFVENLTGVFLQSDQGTYILVGTKEYHFPPSTGIGSPLPHPHGGTSITNGKIHIMPVVKYEEIKHDKESAISNADLVSSRITADTTVEILQTMESLDEAYRALTKVSQEYFHQHEPVMHHILLSTNKIRSDLLNSESVHNNSREQDAILKKQVHKREKMLNNMLHFSRELEKQRLKMLEITHNIKMLTDELKKNYEDMLT